MAEPEAAAVSGPTALRADPSARLTDLPNEMVVLILSFLDTHTVLRVRCVCRQLRAVASDPILWTTISWKASNHIRDGEGFKSVLKLNIGVVKHLSLSCVGHVLHMSKLVNQVTACRRLERIELEGVAYTSAQVVKLLGLPALAYLHLDQVKPGIVHSLKAVGSCLKTLSLSLSQDCGQPLPTYLFAWSTGAKYQPPNLRIAKAGVWITAAVEEMQKMRFPPPADHEACYTLSWLRDHTDGFLKTVAQFQYLFTPSGSVPQICSDMQLFSIVSGSTLTAWYNSFVQLEGGTSLFSGISPKLSELHLSDYEALTSSELGRIAGQCPNLLCLELDGCKEVLSDLEGLVSVASCCSKLRALNLSWLEVVQSEEKLWEILATMSNLRVLFLSEHLLLQSYPSSLPTLTTLSVDSMRGKFTECRLRCPDMQSLKVVRLYMYSQFPLSPHTFSNLTHLHWRRDRIRGCAMELPTDPSCYANLQHLFVSDYYFTVQEELVDCLAQSKKLSMLRMEVKSFPTQGIVKLTESLKSLSVFRLCMEFEGERTEKAAKRACAFAKSLTNITVERSGRFIDLQIVTQWKFFSHSFYSIPQL